LREGIKLLQDERIDDLQCKGLNIIQKKSGFRFGVDAVLLSDFAHIRKNDNVIDLGTGTGIIPLLLSVKTEASQITGLEIQAEMAEMAQRSVTMNRLEDKINIICGDIKKVSELFEKSSFDCVVSNPPYISRGGGKINPSDMKAISRHEILCTLEQLVESTAYLLPPGGRFAFIHLITPVARPAFLFWVRFSSVSTAFLSLAFRTAIRVLVALV
jgi:tRNA1Val (adenine37-N6)-methyltransferase